MHFSFRREHINNELGNATVVTLQNIGPANGLKNRAVDTK